jgi:zinc transporter ZupT
MAKIVIIFGLISGAIAGFLMWLLMQTVHTDLINFDNGMFWGYATMIVALSMVFFGIKSYRDNHGGRLSFLKGIQVGLLISLISAVCYAASWEIYYPKIGEEFMQKYTVYYLDKMKADGVPDTEIETARVEGEKFMEMYRIFYIRFAFSMIEILPVGIIVTLISAALLRKRELLPAST